MAKEFESYQEIYTVVKDDTAARNACREGNCRVWSEKAYLAIKGISNGVLSLEVREVRISPFLSHSFLRIKIAGERAYLFDGTGVEHYDPYFGPEEEAPKYLQDSKPDMLNLYLPRT